ncbi:MAG: SDR family oxidoreductase [Chitinophagales bacterium]
MKKFKDKVAVITGAGSGIGRALALQLAKEGASLALNDFNKERLEETVNLCERNGTKVFSKVFDVSKKEDFYAFADEVVDHFKKVDIVINNAGVALGKYSVLESTIEDFEWVMGINYWGVLYGTKAFLPHLLKEKEAALINISSLFGITGVAYQGAYCSSKFAVRGLTESLKSELDGTNVSVHVVHPGGIKTNIAKDSKNHQGDDQTFDIQQFEKMFRHTPEKAAEIILSAVKKKQSRILIGEEAYLGDFVARITPTYYTKLVNMMVSRFS